MENDGDNSGPAIVYILSGCIAGAIEATATWPTEYIKTKLQLQRTTQDNNSLASTSYETEDGIIVAVKVDDFPLDPPLLPYDDMISGIIYTVQTHGFFGLYYGLSPTLIGSIPKAGLRFGLFSWFSELLQDDDGILSIQMCFLAGLATGVVEALLVVAPVETIKTKCIQLDMPFWKGVKEIIRIEGISGVYHGVLATVLKQSSNHGLRFVWYNEYKRIVTHDGLYKLTPAMAFFGGMTAGVFSALGNQPADVIKTRMQGVRVEYTSTWDCISKTFRREGIRGFYTGIVPRLFRVVPGQGILFLSFELIVSALLFYMY